MICNFYVICFKNTINISKGLNKDLHNMTLKLFGINKDNENANILDLP